MSIEKMRCQAMIDAGIEDPVSKDGIDFCVNNCPYPDGCVLFDIDKVRSIPLERAIKIAFVKRLDKHGVSARDIKLIMHCDRRTVRKYLAL